MQKFEPKIQIISKLTKEKFLDCEVMRKFIEKFRKVIEKYKNNWLNLPDYPEPEKLDEIWKTFLRIFLSILDLSIWSNTNEDLNELLECLDFFHVAAYKNEKPKFKNSLQKILSEFDRQLEPAINIGNANPSFKKHVHKILTDLSKEKLTKNLMKIHTRFTVFLPEECAKYFVENAIAGKKTQEFVFFLHFFNGELK
jgi:hypothetical protein